MLKVFSECPQKYSLIFNEHLEIPCDDKFTEIGKNIHALINYQSLGFDISKMLGELDNPKNVDIKLLWENYLSFNISNIYLSEYTFNVFLNPKTRLTGRVDAIRKVDQTIEILDWKTGSSKNIDVENDMQTIVYLFSIYKLFGQTEKIKNCEDLSMSYYFLKEKIVKTVKFSTDKFKKYEKILTSLTNEITSCKFENTYPSKLCDNCQFAVVCKGTYEGKNNVL